MLELRQHFANNVPQARVCAFFVQHLIGNVGPLVDNCVANTLTIYKLARQPSGKAFICEAYDLNSEVAHHLEYYTCRSRRYGTLAFIRSNFISTK